MARVLHVTTVEFTATRLLLPQLQDLQERGFDVHLACRPDATTFAPELAPFSPTPVHFSRSGSALAMAKGTLDLLRLIRTLRPDVVHLHSPATALPARVGLAVRRYGTRIVYTVHGFAQSWDAMSRKDRVLDVAEKTLSRVSDCLLFQSREDLEAAQRRKYHGHLRFLGNGVDEEWFTGPGVASRLPHAPLRLVYVGRLVREKGVLELLEAVARVPQVELTIIGDALASDRDAVTVEARELAARSPGRVHFVGMLARQDVRAVLRRHDCFVLPSWREGVPRSMIEAMASGLPIIGTDIRGSRELVRTGHEGWIVAPRSTEALVGALQSAAALDPNALRQLGQAAYARASQENRETIVFDRLVAAYEELGVTV